MPKGNDAKRLSFRLWMTGLESPDIAEQVKSEYKTVHGWVIDWERGKTGTFHINSRVK